MTYKFKRESEEGLIVVNVEIDNKFEYQDKDFKTFVQIGDRNPNNLLMEDEVLLQFYDLASSSV